MSSLTKAYLIFLIAFLSLMISTKPVYAAENEGQPLEQQEEVPETLQEEDRQEQTQILSTEEGVFNLTVLVNANLRSEPTTDSKSVIVIPFGIDMVSRRKITNTKGEIWYPIDYSGISGYISSDVVETEAVYMNDSEETAVSKEQKTPEKNSLSSPASGVQTTKTESESKVSDTSAAEGSNLITTSEPKRKTVDSVFIIFMSAALAGVVITLIVFAMLRHEYNRYRKYILKNRKDKAYED